MGGRKRRSTIFRTRPIVRYDPNILGDGVVLIGARVSFRALIDFLGGGRAVAEFLEDFPSDSRERAVAAFEPAAQTLVSDARLA